MKKGVENVEQKCIICGYFCVNRRSLGNHVAKSHKEIGGLKEYVTKFILNNEIPKCLCDCGNLVAWNKIHCKFNDFITGHNSTGFIVKQPSFSKEQIEKRNKSIRKAYESKDIKEKISKSVKEAFEDPDKKKNLIEGQIKGWQSEERKIKHSQKQKEAWSGEAGEIRKKKTFTNELREKISKANMKRDQVVTSKFEKDLITHLKGIFPDLEESKWFNFSTKTWCVDAWVPSLKLMIELDGLYWHALDRSSNFSFLQLKSISNDLIKNKLANVKKLNLVRIKEGIDYSKIQSFESLLEAAYHVVLNGNTIKEGTFFINDETVIFSRELILKSDLTWRKTKLLSTLRSLLKAYVDYHDWFYPKDCHISLSKVLDSLGKVKSIEGKDVSSNQIIGNSYLKSKFHSYWNTLNGPVESFKDDQRLNSVLNYRLGINQSKPYDYKLPTGETVQCHETFDITLKAIRTGFLVQKRAVSFFRPAVAHKLYKFLLGELKNPVVWDPSCGFGARLLGFASAYPSGFYYGTEPATQTYNDNVCLLNDLKKVSLNFDGKITKSGSEFFEVTPESLDTVMTSIPYYDLEKYFDEEGQSWKEYPTKGLWVEKYLQPTFQRAFTGLKPNRFMAINVNEENENVICECAKKVGFKQVDKLFLTLNQDHFSKKRGITTIRKEPILIFLKE